MFFSFIIFLIGAAMVFFAISWRQVPANPPYVALVTRFGSRTTQVKKAGIRLFPFYPLHATGGIPVCVAKVPQEFEQLFRVGRDSAEIYARIIVTWTPDENNLGPYLDHRQSEGVGEIMKGKILTHLRQWAIGSTMHWKSVLNANQEISEYLIRQVAELPDNSPASTQLIGKIAAGVASQPIASLGIKLNRIDLASLQPRGGLQTTADAPAVEERIMEKEKVRVAGLSERVATLMALGYSNEKALALVQMERGQAQKLIFDLESSGGLPSELAAKIKQILNS